MKSAAVVLMVALISAASLEASGLDQVKQKLAQLPGNAPIRARVDIQIANENDDDGTAKKEQGSVAVEVEKSATGISILYPQALVNQAEREAAARRVDPEKSAPIRGALGGVDVIDISEKLDAAGDLLRDLDGAKLVSEKPGAFQGRAVRMLTLNLVPRLSKSEKKRVKKLDLTLKMWIDADGTPLYAERNSYLKASFLLISFEQKNADKFVYGRKDDHLIVTRHDDSSSGSGVGQAYKRKRVVTVTVH